MLKNTLIIALLILAIYLYYQKQSKPSFLTGDNSDSADTIRDLQTQLQQAHQLQTYNSEQLTNYENKVKRLEEQLTAYSEGENWENKTGGIITDLETENKRLDEILTRTANEKNALESKHLESAEKLKATESELITSQKEVERLKTERETTEEIENLESERDEAIREKRTLEQETVSLSNKLKLKSQEADNKIKEIERLKKEKSQSEIALNKTITELREQHRKREKLLDEEQTENNKLTKENEQLTQKVKELEHTISSSKDFDYAEELEQELKAKEQRVLELTSSQAALITELAQTKEKLTFYSDNLKTKEGIIEDFKKETEQLKEQKETATQELNSILIKWTFENKPVESASEFLEKFEKWLGRCFKIEQNWDKLKKEPERLKQIITTQEQKIKELESRKPVNPLLRNHIRELQTECNKKVVSWDLEKIGELVKKASNVK